MFDIDDTPYSFDTILSLFDASGTLIAFDDDSFPQDAGTAYGYDSFLGVISLPAGAYYVAVSEFSNFATTAFSATGYTDLWRPDGEWGGQAVGGATPGDSSFPLSGPDGTVDYVLHISLENPENPVPEPSTLLIWSLLGAIGITIGWRRRKAA